MKRLVIPSLLLFAFSALAQQQEEDRELAELMAVIESETAVATKTRMNSDYVPGIVTVLEGEELEALGFDTVGEALAMVPGVQAIRDGAATSSLIVRGIQFPFNNGNVKILVDAVPLTRESAGINTTALNLPIEAIERIEFIRGPGSVIYGDFAFMGILNIVTKRGDSRVFARAANEVYTSGGRLSIGKAGPQFTAMLASLGSNETLAQRGRFAKEGRDAALLSFSHGGLTLAGQFLQRDIDDTTPAPRPPGPPVAAEEKSWALQARYGRTLRKGLNASVTATMLDTDMIGGNSEYDDRVQRLSADVQWDGFKRQSWLAAAEISQLEIERGLHRPPNPNAPPTLVRGGERNVKSLTLQNQVEVAPSVTITAGARFDDYDTIGSRITPRLSIVWRASDNHILKAQYAEGFRAPTFFEEYGGGSLNRNLDFEVNATTELNYVFRRPRTVARATLFRADLKDMIFGGLPGGRFGNTRAAESQGLELEWTQQISNPVKLVAQAAFVDTEENRGPTRNMHESESAADWMSDLAMLVRPMAHTVVGLHWNHVGDRQVAANGDGYDALDVSASRQDAFINGFTIRGGVKNVFENEIRYIGVAPTGAVNALIYDGRVWWAGVSYRK